MEFQIIDTKEFNELVKEGKAHPTGWAAVGVSEIYETDDGGRKFYYFEDENEVYEVIE